MREDDRLSALLAALANDDAAVRAGARLEAQTLAAWDAWQERQNAPIGVRYRSAALVVGLGGLAAALIAMLALPRAPTEAAMPTASVTPPQRAMAPSSGSSAESVSEAIGRRALPAAERLRRSPSVVARPSASTMVAREGASFVPLGPDVDRELSGSFQLARVRVPRGVLVDLGLLTDAYRGGEPMQADVMFGEDGMAKAIRLVSTSRRIR